MAFRSSTRRLAASITGAPISPSAFAGGATAEVASQLLPPLPLYRRLLRVHRKVLPIEMRVMGDEYIKVRTPVEYTTFLWREERANSKRVLVQRLSSAGHGLPTTHCTLSVFSASGRSTLTFTRRK